MDVARDDARSRRLPTEKRIAVLFIALPSRSPGGAGRGRPMSESAPTAAERAIDGAADDRGLRVAVSPYLFRSMLVGMAGVAIAIHRTTGSRTLAWRFAKARARDLEWMLG